MPPSNSSGDGSDRDVMTSLPRTRPTRRSAKRGTPATPAADGSADTPARARSRTAARPKQAATAGAQPPRRAARSKPGGTGEAATAKGRGSKPAASRAKAKPRAAAGRTPTPRATTRSRATASRASAASAARAADARRAAAAESAVPPAGYATAPEASSGRRGPDPFAMVGTAVQAAGEIAQIGATLWAQALRAAISRLPRP